MMTAGVVKKYGLRMYDIGLKCLGTFVFISSLLIYL